MASKKINIENRSFDISYEIVNPSAKKDFVVLHGWGSNKELMKNAFSSFLGEYRHIYIDLPGFGKSTNDYELRTDDYYQIVNEFLKQLNSSKDIIAGHSYGGKVATLLNPKNLVLLSSAGVLEEKSFDTKLKIFIAKTFNKLGLKKFTKIFRSDDVNTMSENMYATFKNVVDEDFTSSFSAFKNSALIFWGEKDTATSLSSGKKIASLIDNSTFISYDGDHYFFLKYAKEICERIENAVH